MAFWNSNAVEPKRAFRFLMDIGAAGTDVLASYYVKSVKKPNFTMDGAQEVRYIGHTFKYPGRIKWEDISITVIDPASPDATAIMMNILSNSGYSIPVNVGAAVETISKAKANAAMGQMRIRQINDVGQEIEVWTLHNPFFQGVDFGEVNYETDDIVSYTLTVTYDNATLGKTSTTVNPDVASKST
tara:strand:- start:378 stop:935 length:558 start_codon:yes stop_codon:yes gene_type:complete